MPTRIYDLQVPEGWKYEDTMNVLGMDQDHYRTQAGFKCIVSKDFPPGLDGWHVSIGPRGRVKIQDQTLEEEVKPFLESFGTGFIKVWKSPRTGAINFHEDVWVGLPKDFPG